MKWKRIACAIVGALILSGILSGGVVAFLHGQTTYQGGEVFAAQKCSVCHSIAGVGSGVTLDGVGGRLKPDDMKKRIRSPKDVKANSEMKAYPNLPEKDLNNLIAYLQALK